MQRAIVSFYSESESIAARRRLPTGDRQAQIRRGGNSLDAGLIIMMGDGLAGPMLQLMQTGLIYDPDKLDAKFRHLSTARRVQRLVSVRASIE